MSDRVFVGNLSYSASDDDLRVAFEEGGFEVKDVTIVTDRETGQPRGFGFVTLGKPGDAENAIRTMDGHLVAGRPIRVNVANERERRGGGGGGDRRSGGGRDQGRRHDRY